MPGAEQHLARRAGQSAVIETEADRDGELAVTCACDRTAFEKSHRPLHALHATHACKIGVLERLGLFEILSLRIHYPNLRVGDVGNLAAGALENSGEDRGLVLEQERAKGDREDEAEIFGSVAGQHFERDEIHAGSPLP